MMAANTNTSAKPVLDLKAVGDGRSVAKALARVIVRRELIFANLIEERSDCSDPRAAG